MKIVNLTPHDVTVYTGDRRAHVFSCSGMVARVTSARQELLEVIFDEVDVYEPQQANGAILECTDADADADAIIVLPMVAEYLQNEMSTDFVLTTNFDGKHDLRVFAPDTGPESVVRNDEGVNVGVRRLCEYETLSKQSIRQAKAAKRQRVVAQK